MKNLHYFFLSCLIFISGTVAAQTANVQIIHNAPDPLVSSVDVYLYDGSVWISQPVLTDFQFRQATGYVPLPAGSGLRVAFAPHSPVPDLSDTLKSVALPTLVSGENYVAIAAGLVGSTATPFSVFFSSMTPFVSAPNECAFKVFHGIPDFPAAAVWAAPDGVSPLIPNVGYGTFSSLLQVPADYYYLAISTAADYNTLVTGCDADLSFMDNMGIVIFASGLASGGGPSPGLFAALPDGSVIQLPENPGFRIQIAHNAPAPALTSADVYLEVAPGFTIPLLQGLAFRSASPTLLFPLISGNILITNAGGNPASPLYSFPFNPQPFRNYIAVAHGVFNPSGTNFSHAFGVNGADITFGLHVVDDAKVVASAPNKLNVYAFHHGTDVPTVDLYRNDGGTLTPLIPSFSYLAAIQTEIDAVGTLRIDVMPAGTTTPVKAYTAPIALFGGQSVSLLASGFLTPGDENVTGLPSFGLYALQVGGGNFIALPEVNLAGVNEVPSGQSHTLVLYPNPADDYLYVEGLNEKAVPFSVISMRGDLLKQGLLSSDNALVDISDLPAGMYLIRTTTLNHSFNKIFVKR